MQKEELHAAVEIRVITVDIGVGEESPWHFHSEVTENIRCIAGKIKIQYGEHGQYIVLWPGQEYEIASRVVHNLVNLSSEKSTYLLQQKGRYDFVPRN